MFQKWFLMCMFLLLVLGTAQAGEDDPILGRAGAYVVKKSDLERLVSYYSPERQKFLQENPRQKVVLIKRMLEVKVVSDIAKKEGFDQRPDVKEQIEYMVNDQLAKEYLSKGVAKDVEISDSDVRQYYEANKDKFSTPDYVQARHILIKVSPDASSKEREKAKAEAVEILDRIRNGEDFAKIAEEVSEDPGSKAKGGDLGFFARGTMVKPFEDTAFSLKPGQVSGVVETQFGYHIIKVEAYRERKLQDLDEVKGAIREQMKTDLAKAKAKEFLNKATADAGMEIYENKIMDKIERIK